jgi:alkanesulfonate monooxygenase
MTVEFIGFIGTNHQSEIHPAEGPVVDRGYVERIARVHEDGGFDRALVAFGSTGPATPCPPPRRIRRNPAGTGGRR